jgi:hypothetical protein
MQRVKIFVLVLSWLALSNVMLANTWYVRADGGTRYSVTAPNGQCNGQADAPYPGTGVDQPCAFGDYRFLWDDQSYGNTNSAAGNWAIAGGDTVILDNTKQWRVGFDGDGLGTDPWCFGASGPYGCTNPAIPSGTATQHTRILGRNYANCNTGGTSNRSAMTQIFGGHGVFAALNLNGAQFVDIECIEITRHSQCMIHGSPIYPYACNTSIPVDDYDSDGISIGVNAHDVLLQDVWIHGHTDRGILGPIGGLVTANRVNISYNGNAGWDFDTNTGTDDLSVNASIAWHYLTIEWNGCNQEYPAVDVYPAISCYSQSTGGYGDGVGTPPGMGMNVEIDHSIFRYNTQDGLDLGHIDTGSSTISITDSLSYANNGGQFKWGTGFTNAIFENNLALGNCLRMSQPIIGAPSTFNTNLSDFCRSGSTISFNFQQGQTALFANNTFVSYAPSTFDFNCAGSSCSTASMTLTNNIFLGYDNPTTYNSGGQVGGPGLYCGPACNGDSTLLGTINRSNNSYYGIRGACQAGVATESLAGTISSETCNDPRFVGEPEPFTDEAALDAYNFNLSSGSPAIGAGIPVSGLTTDYYGIIVPSPPSLGAIQYSAGSSTPVTPTLSFAAIANQTYGTSQLAVSATSASSGTVTYAVVSGPAVIFGNVVAITGIGTVVLSAAQAAAGNYTAATASTSFTVVAAVPSLSFAAIANQTFGNPPLALSATSVSSGAVTYTVSSGPGAISGNTLTLTGAGTLVLSASQVASGNYAAATTATSLTVAPGVTSLSFAGIASQTFGNPPLTLSATSLSAGAVTYAVTSGPATISGNTLTLTGAGMVALSANQAATLNYVAGTATTSFNVSREVPTLSFAAIAGQTLGNPPFTIVATSVSNAAVTYAIKSGPATLSGRTVTLTGAGTVVLTASQGASVNYAAATATTSFTVTPGAPTLTFFPIGQQTFGSSQLVVSASSPSSGAITYTVTSGPASISGDIVTLTGVGTVVLSASQAASGSYAAATATTSFTVAPEVPALSFTAVTNQGAGNLPNVTIISISPSAGAVTFTVISGPATISGSTLMLTGAGTVVLSATQAASGNYAAATTTLSFTFPVQSPPLNFVAIANQTFGNSPITVAASSVSSGAVTYTVNSGPAAITGNILTLKGVGTVVLSANQAATGSYAAATATTSFLVMPGTPTLSFAAIANQTFGNSPIALSASSSSSGTVTYAVVSGPAAISENTLILTGGGAVVLSANQAASGNYTAAVALTSFTVLPGTSTLTFATVANTTYGAAPFTVSAISASSGAVTYAVVSGPATITGNLVTLTGAGTVVLSATQQASPDYLAATATVTFAVATPSFTLATAGSAASAQSLTTEPGGAATFSLIAKPSSGTTFPDALTLTANGLPPGATATFSPTTIAAGSGTTAVTFTIQTSSQTGRNQSPLKPFSPLALGLLLPFLCLKRTRRRLLHTSRLLAILTLATLSLSAGVSLSGCGGSAGSSAHSLTAAAHTYAVTIVATDQKSGAQSTTSVSLEVL